MMVEYALAYFLMISSLTSDQCPISSSRTTFLLMLPVPRRSRAILPLVFWPSALRHYERHRRCSVATMLRWRLARRSLFPRRTAHGRHCDCLLYTSDAADDLLCVDLGG